MATVTGVIQDAAGNTATSGNVVFKLSPWSPAILYRVGGVTLIAPTIATCGIDATGHILNLALSGACQVWGNDNITPANTCYQVVEAPGGVIDRTIEGVQITGTGGDLSSPTFCPSVRITPEVAAVETAPSNANVIPGTDNFYNVGGPQNRYAQGYFANLNTGSITVSGVCSSCGIGTSIRIANNFAGADLGAQINAADADLGASPGEVWAFGGAAITTQIVVSGKHVLWLFAGTYTNALGLRIPVIRLKDNSSLIGEGVQTIVQESSNAANTTPVIVCAYDLGSQCNGLSPSTANIHISGIHFQGANPNAGTSLIDSVSLGNCKQCSVNDNWFDNIATSHILIGGTSGSGFWGDGFEISGNHFSGEANCSICVINGQNISIHDNFWSAHGNGAAATVDIEPNSTTDHAQNIDIHDNQMDESAAVNSVYCVTIQNGPFVAMGNIKIHDNNCFGGAYTTYGSGSANLISCYGAGPGSANTISDVEIYNNVCRVTVQNGISVGGTNRAYIHHNTIECSTGFAILLSTGTTNARVEHNSALTVTSPTSCGQNARGAYMAGVIGESGTGIANNIFRDNIAKSTILVGTGSQTISTDMNDGSGRSFANKVGLEAGISGSGKYVPLGAPTGLAATGGGSQVGCTLAPQQVWYWKVTAITTYGESPASTEISATYGSGSGCPQLLWNKVNGASGYKVYRGASSGAEGLISTVSDGSTWYVDSGTAAGAAPPSTDSTVVIGGAEGAAPAGVASSDLLWPDSTSHCWKVNNNNGTAGCATYELSGSDAAVDLLSVATGACTTERTVVITGAAFGDAVEVMAGTALEAGGFLIGKVTSSGNIKWQFCNLSGGAIDRASDAYSVKVLK